MATPIGPVPDRDGAGEGCIGCRGRFEGGLGADLGPLKASGDCGGSVGISGGRPAAILSLALLTDPLLADPSLPFDPPWAGGGRRGC